MLLITVYRYRYSTVVSNHRTRVMGSDPEPKLFREWLSGGLANAVTSAFLNPLDVSKTRLQLSGTKDKTLIGTMRQLYREGGLVGLWRPGLTASAIREMLSSGPRAGFYPTVRDKVNENLNQNGDRDLTVKIISAMITGTLGSLIANPIDLVKVRLMGNPDQYKGPLSALPEIYRSEGIRGLYKGVAASTLRGAFIAAGELGTYDHSKTVLRNNLNWKEGSELHVVASLITGVVAATVAAPFDLIKTRAMHTTGEAMPISRILSDVIKHEGPLALFKGWLPSYLRLGPHALICFPVFEQIRRLLGLKYL
jgi:solute carrier family 25 (mitochondrial dicarboxylate transporter), member 10